MAGLPGAEEEPGAEEWHPNNERLLFHETKVHSVKFINKYGFNRSYTGMNETLDL